MIKMNEEEIEKIIETTINKSNKEYISLKEQFEELRNDYIELARSEEQLQNNWNELKKWLEEEYKYYQKCSNHNIGYAMGQIRRTENKMQELEQGKDD